jgi:hypothetical protein
MERTKQQKDLLIDTLLVALSPGGTVTLISDESGYRYTDTYVDGKLVLRTQRGKSPDNPAFVFHDRS